MTLGDRLLNDLIMEAQQVEGVGFIRAHLATKADDVGEHDRGQPPSLSLYRAAGVCLHRPELFCRCDYAVNLLANAIWAVEISWQMPRGPAAHHDLPPHTLITNTVHPVPPSRLRLQA